MATKISKFALAAFKPFRLALFSVGVALLSAWFVASSVATIHFEEQISPLLSDAGQAMANKSADFSRGIARLQAAIR